MYNPPSDFKQKYNFHVLDVRMNNIIYMDCMIKVCVVVLGNWALKWHSNFACS